MKTYIKNLFLLPVLTASLGVEPAARRHQALRRRRHGGVDYAGRVGGRAAGPDAGRHLRQHPEPLVAGRNWNPAPARGYLDESELAGCARLRRQRKRRSAYEWHQWLFSTGEIAVKPVRGEAVRPCEYNSDYSNNP